VFPLGANLVTCSATDTHGNTGSNSFTITVEDTTPPEVTVPADKKVEATGPNGAAATFTASALDIVDGPLSPVCIIGPDHTVHSGDVFPLGANLVTCSAKDAHGNTGSKPSRSRWKTPRRLRSPSPATRRSKPPAPTVRPQPSPPVAHRHRRRPAEPGLHHRPGPHSCTPATCSRSARTW
jgi:hypothetical protein